MRILYNYIFDVTKIIKRDEMLSYVQEFIRKNSLEYKDVLFELSTYKDSTSKRKNYLEKLCKNDSFWKKYEISYPCDVAKNTDIVGVSNLQDGSWIKRNIEVDKPCDIVVKLDEQLKAMPQYGYKIAFNDISWFHADEVKRPLMASGTPVLYPLSSNITIMDDYPQKAYIVLNFEMCDKYKNHKVYVEDFSDLIKCACDKEILFVKDEMEVEEYSRAFSQVNNLLSEIKNTKINITPITQEPQRLHIKKILEDTFLDMNVKYQGNGLYEIEKMDKYKNKLIVYFDYDKELHCLSATLTYMGMGFKHGVFYSQIKPLLCDDSMRQYAEKVHSEVDRFISEYIPLIIGYYKPLPEWFEW